MHDTETARPFDTRPTLTTRWLTTDRVQTVQTISTRSPSRLQQRRRLSTRPPDDDSSSNTLQRGLQRRRRRSTRPPHDGSSSTSTRARASVDSLSNSTFSDTISEQQYWTDRVLGIYTIRRYRTRVLTRTQSRTIT